jgi:hypothetical protein
VEQEQEGSKQKAEGSDQEQGGSRQKAISTQEQEGSRQKAVSEEGFPIHPPKADKSGNDTKTKKEKKTDFTLESQQNLMKIVEYLATDVFRPTTVDEIMTALSITNNKTIWALHNLKFRGWAEQIADGWRLSPRIVRIADAVRANLGETVKRYLGNGFGNGQ